MALTKRSHKPFWHLLAGLAGLTGLTAALVGLLILYLIDREIGLYVLYVSAGLALPAVLLLLFGGLRLLLSQRGAVGLNVALQVLLAIALLVGLNLFVFSHHKRWDITWDETFTIKKDLRDQLSRLRGETTIVLHLRHVTFGQLKESERDNYDAAAERKVMEKVRDLAEQLQELGPKFKVEILDKQADDYQTRLATVTAKAPELRAAIDRSVENAIFFNARGKVQSLSFSQMYQLDRKASREAGGNKTVRAAWASAAVGMGGPTGQGPLGAAPPLVAATAEKRGNLVLRPQGVVPFTRRILNIEEKRPRLAVAAGWDGRIGLEGEFNIVSLRGVKKALAVHGMEGEDIIVKRLNPAARRYEPVALKYSEFRYEQLEGAVARLDAFIKAQNTAVKELEERYKFWKDTPLAKLRQRFGVFENDFQIALIENPRQKEALEKAGRLRPFEERHRALFVERAKERVDEEVETLEEMRAVRQQRQDEMGGLNIENLQEQRRITDVRAKLQRQLADVDLLIVPRFTFYNLAREEYLPNWLHSLDRDQAEAVKEFLKAGKPVLFCLGPGNLERGQPPPPGEPDRLEPLLKELGFTLPEQTILYNAENEAMAEQRPGMLALPPEVKLPPVSFDWPAGTGLPRTRKAVKERPPQPIRVAMRMATRGLESELDLRLRYLRPVYWEPPQGVEPKTDATFMMSGGESWNEPDPFPSRERLPRFEPKADDPERGKVGERRRGPFPIAAAAEVKVPAEWYADAAKAKDRPTVRVAVIGSGSIFCGDSLSPVREKLFLDVSNWLLGRDDQLPNDSERWEYPRVQLSTAEASLWRWGTMLGMPLFFVYLGCAMWMVRRMR